MDRRMLMNQVPPTCDFLPDLRNCLRLVHHPVFMSDAAQLGEEVCGGHVLGAAQIDRGYDADMPALERVFQNRLPKLTILGKVLAYRDVAAKITKQADTPRACEGYGFSVGMASRPTAVPGADPFTDRAIIWRNPRVV
ncbi:MAG: hypothetical protein CME98_26890 [Hyphomonas sp.]|nr:hypothetical protein [Hyphomonas sp.]